MGLLETVINTDGMDLAVDVSVVVEEEVILNGLADVPTALGVLFGLLYALYLEYPKQWKYLFEAVQKVFLGLDSEKCSARIQSLRTRLLQA